MFYPHQWPMPPPMISAPPVLDPQVTSINAKMVNIFLHRDSAYFPQWFVDCFPINNSTPICLPSSHLYLFICRPRIILTSWPLRRSFFPNPPLSVPIRQIRRTRLVSQCGSRVRTNGRVRGRSGSQIQSLFVSRCIWRRVSNPSISPLRFIFCRICKFY